MKKINIGIIGLGNVGSALINYIEENHNYFLKKSLINFNIIGISAKNKRKKRNFDINKYRWFDNPINIIKSDDCDVIVELIGDEKGISYDIIKNSLEQKINVVTGNKALIAKNSEDLFKIAEKNNVLLLFEAAVAGGIPIINTLKNNLYLNNIKKISGILNGTTNYILTEMEKNNLSFKEVLKIAKIKGYTSDIEADLDIDGLDSAHKLTILSTICFASTLNFENNEISGISNIKIEDINYANKLNSKIKLISESFIIDNKIYSVTSPKLINNNFSFANVDGVLNAINIETDCLKNLFLEGEGAGGKATSCSVMADLFEIALESKKLSLGHQFNNLNNFEKFDISNIESSYYLRIMAKDIPGVLSEITSSLTDLNISIEKILQIPEDSKYNSAVPIIIVTHKIKKGYLNKAVDKIENLDFVLEKISILPIHQ
tara:strand:+ start:16765 stop:18060 length:1296 start_codon:yes stop_codon:yes gene_type:complete